MQVNQGFGGGPAAHQVSQAPQSRGPVSTQQAALPAGNGSAAAAPQAAAVFFPVGQLSNPFAVFGSPYAAGGYAGGGASSYAMPFAGGYGGAAQDAAPASQSGHTVSNPTNALSSTPAGPATQNSGLAAMGMPAAFSAGQPAFLVPAMVPMGMPMMFAVGFVAFAAPAMQGPVVAEAPPKGAVPTIDPPAVDSPDAKGPKTEPEAPTIQAPKDQAPAAQKPKVAAPKDSAPGNDAGLVDDVTKPKNDAPAAQAPKPAPSADPAPAPKPSKPVQVVNNAEFERYSETLSEQSLETSMVLSLTTAEGDEVTLDFRQLDMLKSDNFEGSKKTGDSQNRQGDASSTERLVTMAVEGDLSDAEREAIDAVLESVSDVANKFFSGSYAQAMSSLEGMDFDSESLAELSLSMTMTRVSDIDSGYREGADKLDQLRNRGGEEVAALEFLATEQRRLIDQAKEVLEEGSAAKLVRTLVPPLLEDTVNKLRAEVAAQPQAENAVEAPVKDSVTAAA